MTLSERRSTRAECHVRLPPRPKWKFAWRRGLAAATVRWTVRREFSVSVFQDDGVRSPRAIASPYAGHSGASATSESRTDTLNSLATTAYCATDVGPSVCAMITLSGADANVAAT